MKISKRLTTIASFINKDAFVIDVGADHGLLEKYLIDSNITNSIIAVENKQGPFSILKNNLLGYDVELSYSNGLESISDKVDTVVIAGMGGTLICSILKDSENKLSNVENIIVDAHTDIESVRRNVCLLGYHIDREQIVYENKKYYFVIHFKKGRIVHSEIEYEFGVNITKDELFNEYRESQIEKLQSIYFKNKNEQIKSKIERLKSL